MKIKVLASVILALAIALAPIAALSKVGGGDIDYKPKGAGAVTFKHEQHVNYKGFKCADCHYKTFQMGGTSYKMDMSALTKGAFCGKCHEGKKAFDVKESANCKRCHKD